MKRVMSFGVFMGALSLFLVTPVQAADQLIVAHIQPVRYILVDNNDIIQSIQSNTDENITPVVYHNSLMITETPNIRHQYEQILREHSWVGRYGEVYTRKISQENPSLQLLQLMKFISVTLLNRMMSSIFAR